MPLYEYQCDVCEHRFEVIQKFSDAHASSCPECSGAVTKLANRLQRRLMAQQSRSWEFDLEEGVLDTSRLTRVVTDPLQAWSFKV